MRSSAKWARREGERGVLVDIRDVEGTPPNIFERYELGVGAVRIQRGKALLVVIAVIGHGPVVDSRRLGGTVFVNRGGIGKVFTHVDIAVAWLEGRAG